ncbi:MAG: PIN domain-containing protein [Chloroflexota bacterium]
MTVDYAGLERAVPVSAVIALDASVTLAYLAGTEVVSEAATWIFDGCLNAGRNTGVLSTLTAAELLVRPFRAGDASVASVESFLRFFGSIRLVDVSYMIARTAARVRAGTGLAMPDAIVVGTAIEDGAEVLVTNDRAWPAMLGSTVAPLRIVNIGDFVRP